MSRTLIVKSLLVLPMSFEATTLNLKVSPAASELGVALTSAFLVFSFEATLTQVGALSKLHVIFEPAVVSIVTGVIALLTLAFDTEKLSPEITGATFATVTVMILSNEFITSLLVAVAVTVTL